MPPYRMKFRIFHYYIFGQNRNLDYSVESTFSPSGLTVRELTSVLVKHTCKMPYLSEHEKRAHTRDHSFSMPFLELMSKLICKFWPCRVFSVCVTLCLSCESFTFKHGKSGHMEPFVSLGTWYKKHWSKINWLHSFSIDLTNLQV